MSEIEINRVLEQMRAMAAAAGQRPASAETGSAQGPDFAALLKESIDNVNRASQQASAMAQAYERGEDGVELVEVMVAMQKASLSFEAMKQVRNKLLTAYNEIMNMPV